MYTLPVPELLSLCPSGLLPPRPPCPLGASVYALGSSILRLAEFVLALPGGGAGANGGCILGGGGALTGGGGGAGSVYDCTGAGLLYGG